LHGVSLEIHKGQAVAFVGSSGASKTTLANLILGLLKPSEGYIYTDDQDIFQHLQAWQRNIGYVPQSIYLLDATIRNNVAFGLEKKEIDDSKVWKAIQIAQLEMFIKDLPEGLDTVIGENGIRLSGGQRQRLGIARALYHEPEILVLDEATSSLDGETEKAVNRSIELLSGQKTLIIIAHRLSTIQSCDRIYFMKKGTIVDSGTFLELVRNNNDFKRMAESGKLDL
jgi:ATP-binding cassette subfamily C protein